MVVRLTGNMSEMDGAITVSTNEKHCAVSSRDNYMQIFDLNFFTQAFHMVTLPAMKIKNTNWRGFQRVPLSRLPITGITDYLSIQNEEKSDDP